MFFVPRQHCSRNLGCEENFLLAPVCPVRHKLLIACKCICRLGREGIAGQICRTFLPAGQPRVVIRQLAGMALPPMFVQTPDALWIYLACRLRAQVTPVRAVDRRVPAETPEIC